MREATKQLRRHFEKKNPRRPLNSIILGGPGSGKTYVARQFKSALNVELSEHNLSQFHDPRDIGRLFAKISRSLAQEPSKGQLVFFDEFNVKVGGVSAIQFLIQPIYDGEGEFEGEKYDVRRAAFLFSGSYISSRRIYDSMIKDDDRVDLVGFLIDSISAAKRVGYVEEYYEELRRLLGLAMSYGAGPQGGTLTRDVISYVRGLEKSRDFISRMNGFVLELRDLASPLDAAQPRFRLAFDAKDDRHVIASSQMMAQLHELVDSLRTNTEMDRVYAYSNPDEPILDYKNLLLVDRLGALFPIFKKTFEHPVRIRRALLNYLVVVPLIHGVRSLESIVGAMSQDGDGVVGFPKDAGIIERNTTECHNFASPEQIWSLIQRENGSAADTLSGSDELEIG